MRPATAKRWAKQNRHDGDRLRLFSAVSRSVEGSNVLYPGSFVDMPASFVFPAVTYVDTDRRAMASIDARYRLVAVVKSGGPSGYRIDSRALDSHLIPKKPQPVNVERLHRLGRGIGYTRSPFAYLFERWS